jgi:hypothetical protein
MMKVAEDMHPWLQGIDQGRDTLCSLYSPISTLTRSVWCFVCYQDVAALGCQANQSGIAVGRG